MLAGRGRHASPRRARCSVSHPRRMDGHFHKAPPRFRFHILVFLGTLLGPRFQRAVPHICFRFRVEEDEIRDVPVGFPSIVFGITLLAGDTVSIILLLQRFIHDNLGMENHLLVKMKVYRAVFG